MSNKFAELIATPDAFLAFLRDTKPSKIVGVQGNVCNCPLARFLIENSPKNVTIKVDTRHLSIRYDDGDSVRIALPEWAIDFVDHVDEYIGSEYIKAEQALLFLEK